MSAWCRVTQVMKPEWPNSSVPCRCILQLTPPVPVTTQEYSPPPVAASGMDTTSFPAPGQPKVATELTEREPKLLLGKMVAHHAGKP